MAWIRVEADIQLLPVAKRVVWNWSIELSPVPEMKVAIWEVLPAVVPKGLGEWTSNELVGFVVHIPILPFWVIRIYSLLPEPNASAYRLLAGLKSIKAWGVTSVKAWMREEAVVQVLPDAKRFSRNLNCEPLPLFPVNRAISREPPPVVESTLAL